MLHFPNVTNSMSLNAIIIFAVYAVAAKLTDFVITHVFKALARRSKNDIDDRVIALIHGPIFLTVLIVGAMHAITYIGPRPKIMFYSSGALYTVLVIIWTVALIRMSHVVIENALGKIADITGLGRDVIPFIKNVWKLVVIVCGLMAMLSVWKLNITPVLASAGIAGAAVAFAAKDTLANFIGGISIFIDKPYKIGDFIVLADTERGEVVSIGMRSTRIKTRDDVLISVPNAVIANSKIINESAPVPSYRIRIPVGVAYGSDIDQVEKILLKIAEADDNVITDDPPRVRLRAFGDSSLNFELLCWIKEPALRGLTQHNLNTAIYKAFNAEGVTIPFPQRDVHMKKTD